MDETKKRIAEVVDGVALTRRPRASKSEKEAFADMSREVSAVKSALDKLCLRLWHACNKNDYHSLSLEEAKAELSTITESLNEIINKTAR